MHWLVAIVFAPLAIFGLLNLFSPTTTIRWQNHAIARRAETDLRRTIGLAFQRLMGRDSGDAGQSTVRTRVRLLGLVELLIAAAAVAVAWRL